jgi:transposase InsO family protein
MPEAKGPGDILSIDITGPYNTSKEGYRYLLTCIDHFTKWPEAIPLRDQEAPTIARILVNNIFSRHGVYNTVLSDRGRNFMSELVKETCMLLGAKKVFTSPYHPEGNGRIENFHRVLNNGLACEIDGKGTDWVKYVDLVLWAYRSQPHSVTGYSPFYMLYGREMANPGDEELSAYLRNKREHTDAKEWVDELASSMRKIRRKVREKIRDGRRTQQRYQKHGKQKGPNTSLEIWFTEKKKNDKRKEVE